MTVKKIIFKSKAATSEKACIELMWDYLGSLYQNGQIYKNYEIIKVYDGELHACVTLSDEKALDEKNNNRYAVDSRSQLAALFDISETTLGETLSCEASCRCERPSFYLLQYDDWCNDSPVHCGDCGLCVPLYKLPYFSMHDEYHRILSWAEACKHVYGLYMYGLNERYMYRQINRVDFVLFKLGAEICREFEALTKIPFYSYIYKTGKNHGVCPQCKNEWRQSEGSLVHYVCEECRLCCDV
ncbi:MAG: Zn-ribbon-containing protein [Oscillospiraceae bacterium]|jgi:predicted  nucleic acid-binding Zn ribbon protein|nr:Zn-ribbon-containing protein [Oscillospiraceae bacterium]